MVEHLEVLSKKNEWQHIRVVNICIHIGARTTGWSERFACNNDEMCQGLVNS
jgi:hypothetical protein